MKDKKIRKRLVTASLIASLILILLSIVELIIGHYEMAMLDVMTSFLVRIECDLIIGEKW